MHLHQRKRARQQADQSARCAAHPQRRAKALLRGGDIALRIAQQMVEHAGAGGQRFALGGEHDAGAGALEQPGPQLRFQLRDGGGDRRLGDVEAARRSADRPGLADLMEGTKGARIDHKR